MDQSSRFIALLPLGSLLTWPTLDLTTKSLPRYLLIVLALEGDSTITRDLLVIFNNSFN